MSRMSSVSFMSNYKVDRGDDEGKGRKERRTKRVIERSLSEESRGRGKPERRKQSRERRLPSEGRESRESGSLDSVSNSRSEGSSMDSKESRENSQESRERKRVKSGKGRIVGVVDSTDFQPRSEEEARKVREFYNKMEMDRLRKQKPTVSEVDPLPDYLESSAEDNFIEKKKKKKKKKKNKR